MNEFETSLPAKGILSLMAAVKKDCETGENCFNENGCNKTFNVTLPQDNPALFAMGMTTKCVRNVKCFHDYCGKYNWIIERAEHYASVLGTTKEEVLKDWEDNRTYWYMNYYQEANQPRIDNVKVFDTLIEFKESLKNLGFRCPKCAGESKDAYACSLDNCDWKAYGLFGTMGKGVDVLVKDHSKHPSHIFMPVAWEDNIKENE